MARGRPLAFLAMIVTGWVGLRLLYLALLPEGMALQAPPSAPVDRSVSVHKQAALAGTKPSEPAVEAQEERDAAGTGQVVEGLDPAPPGHLESIDEDLPLAAAHNALWMEASREVGKETPESDPAGPLHGP